MILLYGRHWSLPVWECGLKLYRHIQYQYVDKVTPCMGVWIEIKEFEEQQKASDVTPCMGVWIEIHF